MCVTASPGLREPQPPPPAAVQTLVPATCVPWLLTRAEGRPWAPAARLSRIVRMAWLCSRGVRSRHGCACGPVPTSCRPHGLPRLRPPPRTWRPARALGSQGPDTRGKRAPATRRGGPPARPGRARACSPTRAGLRCDPTSFCRALSENPVLSRRPHPFLRVLLRETGKPRQRTRDKPGKGEARQLCRSCSGTETRLPVCGPGCPRPQATAATAGGSSRPRGRRRRLSGSPWSRLGSASPTSSSFCDRLSV